MIDYGTNESFIERYRTCKNTKQMAEYYKTSTTSILKHAHKLGFNLDEIKKTGKLSEADKDYIKSMYLEKTSTELAKQFNVSRGMITKLWYDANLQGKDKSRIYFFKNQDYFENIDTEQKAYFLGFIAADGCVYNPKVPNKQGIIRICIAGKDIEILENFRQELQTNKPISKINQEEKSYVSLELSSQKMFNDLNNLGIYPRKTYGNTWVQLDNEKLQLAFIRGYFDGDGSISHNFNISTLHQVNVSIAGYESELNKIQEFLLKQNIHSKFILDRRDDKYSTGKSFGRLDFTSKQEKDKFLLAIYPNDSKIYLTRKFILAKKFHELFQLNPRTWTYNK